MKLVLLPGLDGTGLLFDPLLRILPSHFSSIVISYPPDEPLGYAELVPYVKSRIPANEDFVIVAESFSGPLAVEIASSAAFGGPYTLRNVCFESYSCLALVELAGP